MAEYSVKRPLKRAPIHPGEVVREDILPALDYLSVKLHGGLGFRANNFTGFLRVHTLLAPIWRYGLVSFLVTAQGCG